MKTIVAGSRGVTNPKHLIDALCECGWWPTEVVSGTARGADQMGEAWAYSNRVPVRRFPADWNRHGKIAGMLRNAEMANYAEALIALWYGESRGTKNMIDTARRQGLKVHVHMVR